MPKKNVYPNATFNGTPVTGISKAAQNNWNHPSKINIDRYLKTLISMCSVGFVTTVEKKINSIVTEVTG